MLIKSFLPRVLNTFQKQCGKFNVSDQIPRGHCSEWLAGFWRELSEFQSFPLSASGMLPCELWRREFYGNTLDYLYFWTKELPHYPLPNNRAFPLPISVPCAELWVIPLTHSDNFSLSVASCVWSEREMQRGTLLVSLCWYQSKSGHTSMSLISLWFLQRNLGE